MALGGFRSDDGVTRRDFVNGALVAATALAASGCSAAEAPLDEAAAWDGFGGVGDYARAHGNSHAMQAAGHLVRDGAYDTPPRTTPTGETYDLVIIGGGLSGMAAALEFLGKRPGGSCLIIENHAIFGGEAKRNEFDVDGIRLAGPQGANSFPVPAGPGSRGYDVFTAIGMPRGFEYLPAGGTAKALEFCKDNFEFQYWKDRSPSFGWFFGEQGGAGRWARDIWSDDLARAPYPDAVKADFVKWRSHVAPNGGADQSEAGFLRWLDSMSYKDLIEKVMGLSPQVTAYADPIVASAISGMGCDVTSARAAYGSAMPGFRTPQDLARLLEPEQHSLPGGNDVLTRHFVKTLIPAALRGDRSLDAIMNDSVDFTALDRPGNPVRMRLGATAIRVVHDGPAGAARAVKIDYAQGGKLFGLTARSVVMAGGSWVTRNIVRDLPEPHGAAYRQFHRTPLLVANVAVRNWRFLASLGLTACRWFDGFGYCCNIRAAMAVGRDRRPLDPDMPAVITFYVPVFYPGEGTIQEQAARGRFEMLGTSYADYERRIRDQMARLFGSSGFRQSDIAGIILNRWGHAYLCPQPGFYTGIDGARPARDIIRTAHGRIAFAHSELNGQQNWIAATDEGRRAAEQAIAVL
ncbi:NAD(P)-binding protein [Sphingomonas colocasiae]|uniref:NAD(P)-binding protein n=1 Tax=Sphingomonas colocasiae TaxID=1848973 RepID=A0ABS7PP27_9SPHN|nr:NAD(P)-binding protein [Sphingomonas colocasiae]MBY8823076.1 NAD(P)-binding protein [Sphingomonas colocasiae]